MNWKKGIIGLVVLGVVGAIGGYIYLKNSGRAESTIVKNEDVIEEPQEVIEVKPGLEIADLNTVSGQLESKPENSELFFVFDGVAGTQGTFKTMAANYTSDGTLEGSKIEVSIDPKTIFTNNSMRDDHLTGSDFFHTDKFPEIQFVSEKIALGDSGYIASGQLDFLGTQNPIEFHFVYKGRGTYDDGADFHVFEGGFPFKLAHYGMSGGGMVPEEVAVTFYLEMVEK